MKLILFLLFPALELYLLVKVGGSIGALNMVLWVFASAVIGMWAVRTQGQGAMLKVRADMNEGRVPQTPFLDGVLLFLGGVLLILPGLISDAVGLFLLIPPARHWAAARIGQYLLTRPPSGIGGGSNVFFFRTIHFPGAGAQYTRASADQPHQGQDALDDTPRQATVIESTAIEINKNEQDKDDAPRPSDKE